MIQWAPCDGVILIALARRSQMLLGESGCSFCDVCHWIGSAVPESSQPRFQFNIQTALIAMFAFALGLAARNIASGLHPLTLQLVLPSSTTPIAAGDSLIIECDLYPKINRRVRVLADGTIALKHVGVVNVSGQTTTEIEALVQDRYKKYFGDSRYKSIQLFRADSSVPID